MKWSNKYQACIQCNTTLIRHECKWLCYHCYDKQRYKDSNRKFRVNLAWFMFKKRERIENILTYQVKIA